MSEIQEPLLAKELAHYRERWQATQKLSDQRITMLLTAIGSAVAVSAGVFAHGTAKGGLDLHPLLSGLWAIVTMISEGIFLRLVQARRSICRDISIINSLR